MPDLPSPLELLLACISSPLLFTEKSYCIVLITLLGPTRYTSRKVGGDVWCAALLLSTWLLDNSEIVRGLDVLELGSGLGLGGITAGYLAKSATLTGGLG